ELSEDTDQVARFLREAQAAGRIGHDNICEVLDFGTVERSPPYLVMPLLRGRSLAAALDDTSPLPLDRAVDVACQILAGLQAAHHAGIVHRDLKPDNIFLTTVGDRDDFVKILDFGISKVTGKHAEGAKDLTNTGLVLGTAAYMAPEQARDSKAVDHRVDVYATGVILYEMLTGAPPFDGENFGQILWKIWNAPVPAPRTLNPAIPIGVEAAILRAIDRDPERRF
ncbi:MAG: serine/threonine-protein kinase, partial [Myxococcota bacterium]|nr:serine/threonine-protein kinase [Myxococcota bacterium]